MIYQTSIANFSSGNLSETILQIGLIFPPILPKTFPYSCLVSCYRRTYVQVMWYFKPVAKEHPEIFNTEQDVGMILEHITDTAIAVLIYKDLNDFE